jgi:hypothetical protein
MTALTDKLDDIGKPAWIALLVLGFIVFWPLGLAVSAFLIWSGRMSCWSRDGRWQDKMERMQHKMERMQEKARHWHGWQGPSSGNRAFDEYRAETMRRLEDEQREFRDFLDRLRHAKDKAEFDQFMADRRARRDNPPPSPEAQPYAT